MNLVNSVIEKKDCVGCTACQTICPQKCITMLEDDEGFKYPNINANTCIGCNKCREICPAKKIALDFKTEKFDFLSLYGCNNTNNKDRFDSSSGGVFSLLARQILKEEGEVYACKLNKKVEAVYTVIRKEKDLTIVRGSKYVQADLKDTFSQIQRSLDKGKKVLFIGTPCYAAGLRSLIPNNINNLIIVDFVCHGVPSPMIFSAYKNNEEIKQGAKMINHRFRNKDKGWNHLGIQLGSGTKSEFSNGKVLQRFPSFRDPYINGFLSGYYLRPSCYNCNYKSGRNEIADITIGDLWGAKRIAKALYDKKGTSLVMIHTEQGKMIWEKICEKCKYVEVDINSVIKFNKNIINCKKMPPSRHKFFEDYHCKGWTYVEHKYLSVFHYSASKISDKLGRFINE